MQADEHDLYLFLQILNIVNFSYESELLTCFSDVKTLGKADKTKSYPLESSVTTVLLDRQFMILETVTCSSDRKASEFFPCPREVQ